LRPEKIGSEDMRKTDANTKIALALKKGRTLLFYKQKEVVT
jgi:hypothetical protein